MRNRTGIILLCAATVGCDADNNAKPTPDALYRQGQALEQKDAATPQEGRQNFMQARDTYAEALQRSPTPALQAKLHSGLANASYWLDDYATAMNEWTVAYPNLDDPASKSFALYRVGICQQRLGQFPAADQTFAKVQQEFPDTDAAKRAREHQGFKAFNVQLATFANPRSAEAEMAKLQRQGLAISRSTTSAGNTVLSIGPAQTYTQAVELKNRFMTTYPQAMILP